MSFQHAPVSKGLMLAYAASSIAVGIFDLKHYLHVQLVPHISRHHQYWRLLFHQCALANSSDLLLTELILYNVSIPVERLFGGTKFASFVVVASVTSMLLEFIVLLLFHRLGLNVLPAGPIAVTLAVLYQYQRLVPSAYSMRILGVTLTNKIFMYVLAWQLAISDPPGSMAVVVVGFLIGYLYRSDAAGLKTYRLPPSVRMPFVRLLLPLLDSPRPTRRSNRALPDGVSEPAVSLLETPNAPPPSQPASDDEPATTSRASAMMNWVDELTGRRENNNATSNLRAPSQTEIEQTTSMFPDLRREDIVRALQLSPNVEAAVETLLTLQR